MLVSPPPPHPPQAHTHLWDNVFQYKGLNASLNWFVEAVHSRGHSIYFHADLANGDPNYEQSLSEVGVSLWRMCEGGYIHRIIIYLLPVYTRQNNLPITFVMKKLQHILCELTHH